MTFDRLLPILPPEFSDCRPLLIAGPCSAETEEQILTTARRLSAAGVRIFRAGVWKPRTKPGGFEGVGTEALAWLQRVKRETGMLVATEVATPEHLRAAIDAGIDLLWIGARTTANPFAMQELADALAGMLASTPDDGTTADGSAAAGTSSSGTTSTGTTSISDIAILVKNPVSPDPDLWIGGIERLYNAGVRRLGVIHRGFSTAGQHLYRNPPHWSIPIELHRRHPQLPIICDPSHIGGRRDTIAALSQQAMDLGFDGLIVEAHCSPDEAWSDSAQQLTPEELAAMMQRLVLRRHAAATEDLTALRCEIDKLDDELLDLLARRMAVSERIGRYKRDHGLPVLQPRRYDELLDRRAEQAEALGMERSFMQNLLRAIHEESVHRQLAVSAPEPPERSDRPARSGQPDRSGTNPDDTPKTDDND